MFFVDAHMLHVADSVTMVPDENIVITEYEPDDNSLIQEKQGDNHELCYL